MRRTAVASGMKPVSTTIVRMPARVKNAYCHMKLVQCLCHRGMWLNASARKVGCAARLANVCGLNPDIVAQEAIVRQVTVATHTAAVRHAPMDLTNRHQHA